MKIDQEFLKSLILSKSVGGLIPLSYLDDALRYLSAANMNFNEIKPYVIKFCEGIHVIPFILSRDFDIEGHTKANQISILKDAMKRNMHRDLINSKYNLLFALASSGFTNSEIKSIGHDVIVESRDYMDNEAFKAGKQILVDSFHGGIINPNAISEYYDLLHKSNIDLHAANRHFDRVIRELELERFKVINTIGLPYVLLVKVIATDDGEQLAAQLRDDPVFFRSFKESSHSSAFLSRTNQLFAFVAMNKPYSRRIDSLIQVNGGFYLFRDGELVKSEIFETEFILMAEGRFYACAYYIDASDLLAGEYLLKVWANQSECSQLTFTLID